MFVEEFVCLWKAIHKIMYIEWSMVKVEGSQKPIFIRF